ncbi:RiPP maturation radical SAM C-methyltransferase [Streptomyces anulatus]|uniref:RiPP maturation radical SAM C-methyltransferase n=1 Tax=Streptomyces anulatus TaxID=1892 RepID=UPI00068B2142|nr:RiPP maturation radical SAM C-methyltransferase [Streptomyces anulatus]
MSLLEIEPRPVQYEAEEQDCPARSLRVLLVCMPWAALDMPSLALSTLTPLVRDHKTVKSVDVLYANLRWADHVFSATEGRVGERHFNRIARGDFIGTGEWIFSSALGDQPGKATATPFHLKAAAQGAELEAPAEMYALAPDFVRQLAREIAGGGYDVVGLTSTFDQNIPSLALAGELAAQAPDVITILGGANCEGSQGAALHRNYPSLDYVVRGEAELVLPELLRVVARSVAGLSPEARTAELKAVSGLCWRAETGESRVNPPRPGMVPMDSIPTPDFGAYFDEFRHTEACNDVLPKVPVEGGRGCWWGEKHHCTFCGLNGTTMAFRAKPPERVLREVADAVKRHQVLDVLFADNIIDMKYLNTLLPGLGELGWDLRLFFEVKSNLTYRQLRQMADGGVTQIQPGIESLSTHVLSLMRKGVTGWQNVRLLRDCGSLAIFPSWNILYGFPGETWADYSPSISQIDQLVHLFPPDVTNRIRLTRFSPYFSDPALGMTNQGPSSLLSSVYGLPEKELEDLVYVFDSAPAGLDAESGERLERAMEHWQRSHPTARLVGLEEGEALRIVDERRRRAPQEFLLGTPLERDAYRSLLKGRKEEVLGKQLRESGHETANAERVADLLAEWREYGLIYQDGDHYVALATGLEW